MKEVLMTINMYIHAFQYQPFGKFFHKGFVTAVDVRISSRPDNRNLHLNGINN